MDKYRLRMLFVVLAVATLVALSRADAAEFRAFWVDAWGSGFENPTATTTMINYVDSCNCNAVIPEVRKRCDSYYDSSLEPVATSVTPEPGYDCLADIVTKAHNAGLEVHPWVIVYRAWTSQTAPPHTTPDHVFNTHPEWFSLTNTGSKFDGSNGSYLDPGHPDVEDWNWSVFHEIIHHYDVDGFVMDYIRYAGTTWGYNATAVARYNAEYGLSGNPSYTSTQWCNWRRDQVTSMVKRTYLEAKALKSGIKIGAAIWNRSSVGSSSYFQDWDTWMSNHWLDYGSPMAYTTSNTTFNSWVNTYYNQQYGHHIYPAQGSYMNTISNSMTQINYVVNKPMPGVEPYSYRVTNSGTVDRTGFRNALLAGPFASYESVPTMSWISSPTYGMLKGLVKDSSGDPIYPATVTIQSESTKNSGTGFYGFVDLSTGSYTVSASATGYNTGTASVTISAGSVTTRDITLTTGGGGGDEIIIDNPSASFSGTWSTGTSSTDKYGSDYRYANTATSDTATAIYRPNIGAAGDYAVYCWYPEGSNRSTAARYTVYYSGGNALYLVNQTTNGGQWNLLTTRPFAAGTSGYTRIANGTSESSKVVMADAVKLVYGGGGGDTQPPSVPTGLSATAVSPTQVNLAWNASTDNVGVTGYRVFRNSSEIGTSTTTSYSDTTCSPNTSYTYTVSAYDGAGNESAQSSPATVTTPGTLDDIIIDNPSASFTGTWSTGTSSTDKYGSDYRFANTASSDTATAIFRPTINAADDYACYCWYPQGSNRSTAARYTVYYSGGSALYQVNQTTNGGQWNLLTTRYFASGTTGYTRIANGTGESSKVVMADACRWLQQ